MRKIHITRSTKDGTISGSFNEDSSQELDFGPKGAGEVIFSYTVRYSVTAELRSISKGQTEWFDYAPDDPNGNGAKSKNPPWADIERAITRYINSSEFRDVILQAVGENVG